MNEQTRDAQEKTILRLVELSKRTVGVAIRQDFVQTGTQNKPEPGILGKMVRTHNDRALDLFLLHRLSASSEPWDVMRPSVIWARALGLDLAKPTYASDAVSKLWTKLETYKLVEKTRESRMAKVISLHESGNEEPYTSPRKGYFNLPLEYWTDGWYHRLSFPAKASLLIASSLQPGFYLPQGFARKWYGISSDTLGTGLKELADHGILHVGTFQREDWGTVEVTVTERRYTLRHPFGRKPTEGVMKRRFTKTVERMTGGGDSGES